MIFYMITLAGVLAVYVIILGSSIDRSSSGPIVFNCGPFESYSLASDYLFDYLDDYIVYFCSQ